MDVRKRFNETEARRLGTQKRFRGDRYIHRRYQD